MNKMMESIKAAIGSMTKNVKMPGAPSISAGSAGSTGRPMKFPYTYSAKIAQFPIRFYFNNNWIWKYYIFAIIATIPIFNAANNLANSDANKEKWAAQLRKDAMHEAEHAH